MASASGATAANVGWSLSSTFTPSAAAAWRTTTRACPAGTGVRSSAYAVSVGLPSAPRWAISEPLKPAGTVTVCDSSGVSVFAAPAVRMSMTWSPAGIDSGSVTRSGWNVAQRQVPVEVDVGDQAAQPVDHTDRTDLVVRCLLGAAGLATAMTPSASAPTPNQREIRVITIFRLRLSFRRACQPRD